MHLGLSQTLNLPSHMGVKRFYPLDIALWHMFLAFKEIFSFLFWQFGKTTPTQTMKEFLEKNIVDFLISLLV